jgi:hypothetical protein
VLGFSLGALVTTLLTITATGYHFGLVEVANHEIYGYQRDKIGTAQTIDIAFVGDSSLGNAIDAELFGSLAGHDTVNLALTGSYGSGGAYNMTYKVLQTSHAESDRGDAVDRRDAQERGVSRVLLLQRTVPAADDVTDPHPGTVLQPQDGRRVIEQLWKHGFAKPPELFKDDYIAQTSVYSPPAELGMDPLLPNMIAQSQLDYVGQIAELCRRSGTECVWAYGPIYDAYCTQAADYVAKVEAGLVATGLPIVAGTPLCIPEAELGDTVDHVRPDLKDTYTRRYFELLQPYIDRSAAIVRTAQ